MRYGFIAAMCVLIACSCASKSKQLKGVDKIIDISAARKRKEVTYDNARKVLKEYSAEFTIPNPLFGKSTTNYRRIDPSHQASIICRAVLLDKFSTEADIQVRCRADSLDEQRCSAFREEYIEKHIREGMFRIRLSLESGFSDKSMDPDLWAIYIENAKGIMIEPDDIVAAGIGAARDSVYSAYQRMRYPRNVMRREITLYFKRNTFFGQDLFGGENPYIIFVMSRERKTLARVAWNLTSGAGSLIESKDSSQ